MPARRPRANLRSCGRLSIWLSLTIALLTLAQPVLAQQRAPAPPRDVVGELMMFFYKDPQPARITNLLKDYEGNAKSWEAFPSITGFYGVIFRKFPGEVERLIPEQFDARTAESLRAAFRLAGSSPGAKLQARINARPRDTTLQKQFAGLPDGPEKIVIATPTHLDLLWGASFASGDPVYVNMIIRFIARTADKSDQIAVMVARLGVSIAGGSPVPQEQWRGKYSEAEMREMTHAATALWATVANARRHPFVDQSIEAYLRTNPRAPSALILAAATNRPMPK